MGLPRPGRPVSPLLPSCLSPASCGVLPPAQFAAGHRGPSGDWQGPPHLLTPIGHPAADPRGNVFPRQGPAVWHMGQDTLAADPSNVPTPGKVLQSTQPRRSYLSVTQFAPFILHSPFLSATLPVGDGADGPSNVTSFCPALHSMTFAM